MSLASDQLVRKPLPSYEFFAAQNLSKKWAMDIVDCQVRALQKDRYKMTLTGKEWDIAVKVPVPPHVGLEDEVMTGSVAQSNDDSYATYGPEVDETQAGNPMQMTYRIAVLHADASTPVVEAGIGGNLRKVGRGASGGVNSGDLPINNNAPGARMSCLALSPVNPDDVSSGRKSASPPPPDAIDVGTMQMLNLKVKLKVSAFSSRWYLNKSLDDVYKFRDNASTKHPMLKFPVLPGELMTAVGVDDDDKKAQRKATTVGKVTVSNAHAIIGGAEHGLTLEQQKNHMQCFWMELFSHFSIPFEKETMKFLEVENPFHTLERLDMDYLKYLCKTGCNPNERSPQSRTPMHIAALKQVRSRMF